MLNGRPALAGRKTFNIQHSTFNIPRPMSFALYLITALTLLWLAHRFITPLTRRDALLLILLPMLFTGRALLTGGVYAPVDLPYITEPLRDMREPLGVPRPHNGILSDLYAQ